jgi:hypothetical protein
MQPASMQYLYLTELMNTEATFSSATTQTLRGPTASLLQLEFVMAISNLVLDAPCFGRMFERQSYVVQNYGPG